MNKRLVATLEKVVEQNDKEDVLCIDAYNGQFNADVFTTILTGIDYRCMHFVMEYEKEGSLRSKPDTRQER